MFDSREFFSKQKLTNDELIKAAIEEFNIKANDILIVNDNDDWLKRKGQEIVFQCNGLIDDKEEEYYGTYYYDIFIYKDEFLSKLKSFVAKFNTEVILNE